MNYAKALKNKITNKVGGVLAAPKVAYYGSKTRQANKDYTWLKSYNDKKKSGITPTVKDQAIMQGYKERNG